MTFKRRINADRMNTLRELSGKEGWWHDLLSCWQPSGYPINDNRFLRLAIRDNYLNFYYKGQSVAKVGFDNSKDPYMETHAKYLSADVKEQRYERISSADSIRKIVVAIKNGNYLGDEKVFVDKVVAGNHMIIDLEMALPSGDKSRSALRMDLVNVEGSESAGYRIVFWEAKMASNPELVSRDNPKIIKQISDYEKYLVNVDNQRAIKESYLGVCKLTVDFHEMAREAKSVIKIDDLGSSIKKLAKMDINTVQIDTKVRLVIGHGESRSQNWLEHVKKLTDEGITCLEIPDGSEPSAYRLVN